MSGELGPTLAMVWNAYVFGQIPAWAALAIMLVTFSLSMLFQSVFVR